MSASYHAFNNTALAERGVDLTARASGTAAGPATYTFYCNRSDLGVNITTPYDAQFENIQINPYVAERVCKYEAPGTYYSKVIVQRDGAVAQAWRTNVFSVPPAVALVKFSVGQSVKASGTYGVNVRATPRATGVILGKQLLNATGSALEGPVHSGGYWWWKIDFASGADGWVAANNIVSATPSTATPTSTTTTTANSSATKSGAIVGLASNLFTLRTSTNSYTVTLSSATRMTDGNGAISVADLNDGMMVAVTGSNVDSRIQAETLTTAPATFTGTIEIYTPSPSDTINVASFILRNTTSATRVIIPRGAKLLDSNGPITLQDLNDGMSVSIRGAGTAGAFIRTETLTTAPATFTGTIEIYTPSPSDTINVASFILRNTTSATRVIIPRGAKLLDSNGPITLQDLNDGMSVSIRGAGTAGAFIRTETLTTAPATFTGTIGGTIAITVEPDGSSIMMDTATAPFWQFVRDRATGATNQKLASFVLKAGTKGPVSISQINITDSMSEVTDVAVGSIVNLKLFKSDGTQVGMPVARMVQQASGALATFGDLSVQIQAGGSEVLTLRGDIAAYPNVALGRVHKFGFSASNALSKPIQAVNAITGDAVTISGLPVFGVAQRVYRSVLSVQNPEAYPLAMTPAPDQVIARFKFTNSSPGDYSTIVSDMNLFNTTAMRLSGTKYITLKLDSPTGPTVARKAIYQHQGGWGTNNDWGGPSSMLDWSKATAMNEIPLAPFTINTIQGFGSRDLYVLADISGALDPSAIQTTIMTVQWSDGIVSDVLKGWGGGLTSGVNASYNNTSSSSLNLDTDLDGFSDVVERFISTNSLSGCGENAWPPDVNNDTKVTILDILAVSGNVMSANILHYAARYDLNTDGLIDQRDIDVVTANHGKTCTVVTSDTAPPTVPIGLVATAVSSSQIRLSWTASGDNVFVSGYRIFRCANASGASACVPIYTTVIPAVTTYTDSGLTRNTSYTYAVIAKDYAQNESSQSAVITAVTLP